ncbi:MAG: CheR family methyltransferase [bacterium]
MAAQPLPTNPPRVSRDECRAFLQEHLPRLHLRWRGFRKVQNQVRKRLRRRLSELGLADLTAYGNHLSDHPEEWGALDRLCRITISRFYRDRGVWERLAEGELPQLAGAAQSRDNRTLRCWCAGCASGEEPYTLSLVWHHCLVPRFPDVQLAILATDIDPHLLERARRAEYPAGSLRELPPQWREASFIETTDAVQLVEPHREPVTLLRHDLRDPLPSEWPDATAFAGSVDLVLCRYLAFTYFDESLQRATHARLGHALRPGGVLVLGKLDQLLPDAPGFTAREPHQRIYQRT